MLRHLAYLVLLALAFASSAFAQQAVISLEKRSPVETVLNARIVVQQPGGKESLQPADRAKPGDIVDYQVTYSNTGNATVNSVYATLPIPAGYMIYLPTSARPAAVMASVDGKSFAPLPLQRLIKDANGNLISENTPISEYRFLRWDLGALGAGKSAMVSARMQVIDATTAVSDNKNDSKRNNAIAVAGTAR